MSREEMVEAEDRGRIRTPVEGGPILIWKSTQDGTLSPVGGHLTSRRGRHRGSQPLEPSFEENMTTECGWTKKTRAKNRIESNHGAIWTRGTRGRSLGERGEKKKKPLDEGVRHTMRGKRKNKSIGPLQSFSGENGVTSAKEEASHHGGGKPRFSSKEKKPYIGRRQIPKSLAKTIAPDAAKIAIFKRSQKNDRLRAGKGEVKSGPQQPRRVRKMPPPRSALCR